MVDRRFQNSSVQEQVHHHASHPQDGFQRFPQISVVDRRAKNGPKVIATGDERALHGDGTAGRAGVDGDDDYE